MMVSRLFLFLYLSFLSIGMFSQVADQKLTLEDAVSSSLLPRDLMNLSWIPGTNQYAYTNPFTQNLMYGDESGKEEILIELEQLAKASGYSLFRFPGITWTDGKHFSFRIADTYFECNLGDKSVKSLYTFPAEAENHVFASNQNLAYTMGYNVFVMENGESKATQVTKDGHFDLTYGEAAHRNEFGITSGLFWANSGNQIAFYRVDQSMVTNYPLVNYYDTPASMVPDKYPMAGDKSHHASIGVYNLKTGSTVYLKTGTPLEQYLTNITWAPDDKSIFVAVVNREQNHLRLNQYDATTGELIKTLFEEKHGKYVEPEHGPIFRPNYPDQFFWFSERDGFNHLYLYHIDGTRTRQVTQGNWEVTEFLGFDERGSKVFFIGTAESPIERHIYSANIANQQLTKYSRDPGFHSAQLSQNGEFILDTYSSMTVPGKSVLIETDKNRLVKDIYLARNPLEGYDLGEMEIFPIKADDGTDLYCRLIKPANFDPAKKYPVMVYVYGGPHVQLVQNSWQGGARLFLQYMAQKGYIVFTLDNRGTSNRGLKFEQETFRNLGTKEIEDQLQGVRYLRTLTYVDTDRLGVYGWSFGGFMTTSLMLRKPGVFKVGVAGGPVIDWRLYEIMYTERYMDTPEENPQGYDQANLLNYVSKLKGDLLIIHGQQDDVVVPQHSFRFVRKCVEEGIQIDYFPYPTHPHNVRGIDRAHLLKKISKYFDDHL
ncbi:MAG: DPP IV N-terminal domain-containing protein [Bacteroidetes bacterium]|nr:DPP IV N-terminal domain-containing protein [Bacteroidota bacterium]